MRGPAAARTGTSRSRRTRRGSSRAGRWWARSAAPGCRSGGPRRRTQGTRSSRRFQARAIRPPGRSTRAISGRARSRSNQWKAWPATTRSVERDRERDPLGGRLGGRDAAEPPGEPVQHRGERVGGHHAVPERDQLLGQLAGAGAQLEDVDRGGAGQPLRGLPRVRRPGSVVRVGDPAEGQGRRGPVVEGSADLPPEATNAGLVSDGACGVIMIT